MGGTPTFRCGVCDGTSTTGGRKRLLVRGVPVYACAACVQVRAARLAAKAELAQAQAGAACRG